MKSEGALASPLLVLVSSRSQRQQLQLDFVERAGRSLIGLRVETFAAAATRILERQGELPPAADTLFPLLVQRAVDAEAELVRELGGLRNRASVVAAPVADLLDAGLDEVSAEALQELLAAHPGGEARLISRARALIRVAARVRRELCRLGWARPGDRFEQAALWLDRIGGRALPSRGVWIYGAADATGRLYDFLEAIVRSFGARVIVDVPADFAAAPLEPGAARMLTEYAEPFIARFGGVLPDERTLNALAAAPATPRVRGMAVAGAELEVRAVAARIQSRLEAGVVPESIAVVVRSLEPYAIALRTQLLRLGIPFSGDTASGPAGAEGMRARSVATLLRRGVETPIDRWLEVLGQEVLPGAGVLPEARRAPLRRDLSLALHALGVGRLGDLADLRLEARLGGRSELRLPAPARSRTARAGADRIAADAPGVDRADSDESGVEADDEDFARDAGAGEAARTLNRSVLEAARERARALVALFSAWEGPAPAELQQSKLEALVTRELGLVEHERGARPLRAAIERLSERLPRDFELDRAELAEAFERELAEVTATPIGGAGGGVQVLDVMAARGLAWRELFVLGLNRNVFPRAITEDPLLSDALRAAMLPVLPDLPIKARGHLEEEHLFAQLLCSAEAVTLTHQTISDEGAERAPSSLLRRYRLAHPDFEVEAVAPNQIGAAAGQLSSSFEHAVRGAVNGTAEEADATLRLALEAEAGERLHERPSLFAGVELAGARRRVLQALEEPPQGVRELGPYLGRLGAAPAVERIPITTLEALARCPWQAFLRKVLRVEPVPDALDVLPGLEPRWIGVATHAVFELCVRRGFERQARDPLARPDVVEIEWPVQSELEALLTEACELTLIEAGLPFAGLARALAEQVRPRVCAARSSVWPADGSPLRAVGAELSNRVKVEGPGGAPRFVYFRADLVVERGATTCWIDFKTGAPLSLAVRADTRHKHFVKAITSGRALQTLAYVHGHDGDSNQRAGAYVFLDPDLAPEHALFVATREDTDLCRSFEQTLKSLIDAWDAGVFFPRLVQAQRDQAPGSCRFCELREACWQGDSGARARLRRAMDLSTDATVRELWQMSGE